MRIPLRVIAVVALVLVVAAVALALLLPSVLASEAVRQQIQTAAEEALGREVRCGELSFGFFPPSLLALHVAVSGAFAQEPPLIAAERVALRVALFPLLSRTVVLDSFVVQGATVHLVRTEDGIQLPRPPPARVPPPDRGGPTPPGEGGSAAFATALVGFELRDGAVVLEDRSISPPVIWKARNLRLRARGTSPHEPVAWDLSLDLESGGRLAAVGTVTLAGEVGVEFTLDAVAVAPAQVYLTPGSELSGALSGTVVARGPAAAPASAQIDVALDDGRFQLEDMTLRGRVDIKADVRGGLASPRGTFDIDATDAEILYGEMFEKPPGDAATVTGTIVTESDGTPGVDDVRLKIRNFKANARVRS